MRNQIVILEDNDERQQRMLARLRGRLPPCPVSFFKSAREMLAFLPEHLSSARVISLDNDLERQSDSDPDPGAGRDVARYLSAQSPACPIIIHSTNTFAAVAMETELQDAGWQVQRVTPYDDLAWVDREWFWAVREALLAPSSLNVPLH
jgi:thioesterase domain-containing protein